MPRGFLVKRKKKTATVSYRSRYSDEDRSDSSSDHDQYDTYPMCPFPTPEPGYVNSAFPFISTHSDVLHCDRDSSTSSPLSTHSFPSPLPFPSATVDRERFTPLSPSTPPVCSISVLPSPPPTPGKRQIHSVESERKPKTKKLKAARKLNFDDDNRSPVHGTIIKSDPALENVGIDGKSEAKIATPEAKAEMEKIVNKLGEYVCQLCKERYTDPFSLAQHKCSRIVHVEYRCPECDKVFNCPANLASHRRWHKPRPTNRGNTAPPRVLAAAPPNGTLIGAHDDEKRSIESGDSDIEKDAKRVKRNTPDIFSESGSETNSNRNTPSPIEFTVSEDGMYECEHCAKKFRRQAYLRKHMPCHDEGGNEDRSHPCQYCGKMFRSLTSRAKHVLSHAIGPKHIEQHTCNICGSSFTNKGSLERHARIHSSEIYSCKYCSSTFYSSPGLTRHINKCHPSENRQVILLQLPVQQ
ncbi:insulinoma-associated protein 1a-like [Saccoglossus kowalevskii]|uniref:Insulinoma-associated protein 1-like n=1 Tax=Saccoglossus kowalevskii TaxID=10224 RepID=A0ABM0MXU8_SACKO|nr:PREDICTED: insulinoma-associated protein 1-like [Saccoglossus kowalevskii]